MRPRAALLLLALLLAACSAGPGAVHWGVEECAHCQMMIADERYAAQVVDRRGRTFKFDAIECMTSFLRAGELAQADVHSVWVADGRERWITVEDAHFVHSERIRSPMGGGLAAYADEAAARRVLAETGGALLAWADVLRLELPAHDHGSHAAHDSH